MTPYGPTSGRAASRTRAPGPGAPRPSSTSTCGTHWREPQTVARRFRRPHPSRGRRLLHHRTGAGAHGTPRPRPDLGGPSQRRRAVAAVGRRDLDHGTGHGDDQGGGAELAAGPAALRTDRLPPLPAADRGAGPPWAALHDARTRFGAV